MSTLGVPTSRRAERRIALRVPASGSDNKVVHAMQLFDSVLWAVKGTTRSTWTAASPDIADVIVVHQDDPDERIATWRAHGKLVVEIVTEDSSDRTASHALVYPFRVTQAVVLLERLDVELNSADALRRAADQPYDNHNSRDGVDSWGFVEALRTLREVQNSEAWLVGRDAQAPVLWLKSDATAYLAEPSTVQAIRLGVLDLSRLKLSATSPPLDGPSPRAGVELSWFAGYHAGNKLAPWLSSAESYRVKRWPNFGLIRPLPAHIRITAALASAPADLAQLVSRAHTSMEEAVRTLNALAVCDTLMVAESNVAPAPQFPGVYAQSRGGFVSFLRNLRKHLGIRF